MSHTSLKKACLDYLAAKDIWAWASDNRAVFDPKTGTFRRFAGVKGVPDISAVAKGGIFMGIEIKDGKDRQRPAQKRFEREVKARGGIYLLVREIQDLIDAIG